MYISSRGAVLRCASQASLWQHNVHQSMTSSSTTTHTHHNNTPSTVWSRDYPYPPPPNSISSWKRGRRRIFRSEIVPAWDCCLEIHVRYHCHTWHMRIWMLRDHCFFWRVHQELQYNVKAGYGDECSYFFVLWNNSVPHFDRCTHLFMERERGRGDKEKR